MDKQIEKETEMETDKIETNLNMKKTKMIIKEETEVKETINNTKITNMIINETIIKAIDKMIEIGIQKI